MTEDLWFSPKEIEFTLAQTIWLLRHYYTLLYGEWPKEPRESGYIENDIRVKPWKRRAYFEIPCEVCAELDMRMAALGEDESIIRALYVDGLTQEEVAKWHGLSQGAISRRKDRALEMMTGIDRQVRG